jgi:hypothetical protein
VQAGRRREPLLMQRTKALTSRPFGVNFVLEWDQRERLEIRAAASPSSHTSSGSEPNRSKPDWRENRLLTASSSPSRTASKKRLTTSRSSGDGSTHEVSRPRPSVMAPPDPHLQGAGKVQKSLPLHLRLPPVGVRGLGTGGLSAPRLWSWWHDPENRFRLDPISRKRGDSPPDVPRCTSPP